MNRCKTTLWVAALTVGITGAQADILTTADGNGADDDVIENNADSNSGTGRTFLEFRSRNVPDSTRHRVPVFKFDISSITADFATASFSWSFDGSDTDTFNIDIFGVNDGVVGEDDWTPAGLTYNTLPGGTGSDYPNPDRDLDADSVTLLGTATYTDGTSMLSISGADLVNFLNADSNGYVTLIMEAQEAAIDEDFYANVRSAEGAANGLIPTLDYTLVPEPSTLSFLGMGLFGLMAHRRRR